MNNRKIWEGGAARKGREFPVNLRFGIVDSILCRFLQKPREWKRETAVPTLRERRTRRDPLLSRRREVGPGRDPAVLANVFRAGTAGGRGNRPIVNGVQGRKENAMRPPDKRGLRYQAFYQWRDP